MRAALLLLLAAACGGASSPIAGPAAPEPGIAPRPFTADQIRGAMPVGTDMRFRVEEAGKPAVVLHWHVTAADATTVTMTSRVLAEDGTVLGDDGASASRWDDLVKHATFPDDRTRRTEGTADVPAGTFATLDYVVTEAGDGSTSVSTFRFAKTLPGPPVSLVVEKDGTVVRRMTLLSRTPAR